MAMVTGEPWLWLFTYNDDEDGVKYDPNNWPNLCPVSKSCAWKLLWLFTGRGQAAICRGGAWTKLWKVDLQGWTIKSFMFVPESKE